MNRVIRPLLLLVSVFVLACSPVASSPSPTVAPTATAAPTATPTLAPSPSPTQAPTVPPGTPIPLPTGAQLSAPTADVIWALVASTHLFRSTDRGATWTERFLPPQTVNTDITFVNDREGWILSSGSPATGCQAQSFTVWHTADGAQTWERLFQSDAANDTLCKNAIAFATSQNGFITMYSNPGGTTVIARTTDGGRTWTRSQPLAAPAGAAAVFTAGRVKTFGATSLVSALGGTKAYAFRSTDGGATWSYVSTGTNEQIEISFVTASRWIQIFLPNQSSETTDAGVSWHAFTTDYQQAAPVSPQVVFGDANVGYATVRGSIQRTLDGGAHWGGGVKTPGT